MERLFLLCRWRLQRQREAGAGAAARYLNCPGGDVGLVERLFPLCHWRLQRQREAVEQDRTNNAKDLTDPFSVLKENNVKNVYRPDG